ncbi:uncharacterized protein LOC108163818 [Drosophila miranda]|uniref:uncharacterized protein LOC108163818 n=1 Tax=Drosophila miranda TaxID=7229 RepID=UPI0007E5CB9E|nr:uncharacterized protein LOC108163818 [Drosophila miranda]
MYIKRISSRILRRRADYMENITARRTCFAGAYFTDTVFPPARCFLYLIGFDRQCGVPTAAAGTSDRRRNVSKASRRRIYVPHALPQTESYPISPARRSPIKALPRRIRDRPRPRSTPLPSLSFNPAIDNKVFDDGNTRATRLQIYFVLCSSV